MIVEVYDALISAGASEKKAKAAATALASEQLATKGDITKIEKELAILKGIGAIILTLCITILIKLFLG